MPRPLSALACTLLATLLTSLLTTSAHAGFTSFVIREGGGGPPSILPNNAYVPGATEFVISASGQKAGWGTGDINGFTIDAITNVSITRHDDTTRFTAGSGPAVAPYFNIWVTDGLGNYAVLPTNPRTPTSSRCLSTTATVAKATTSVSPTSRTSGCRSTRPLMVVTVPPTPGSTVTSV